MLFILGIVAVPVSAHFTVGEHIAAYPFRRNDFDPHVKGLVGYIFPGAGVITSGLGAPGWYTGTGSWPGYQSPWPQSRPGPPAVGTSMPEGWYQLESNNYAPFGAILTSTIKAHTAFKTMWYGNPTLEGLEGTDAVEHPVKGDLILAFNVTAKMKDDWRLGTPNIDGSGPIGHTAANTWPFGPNSLWGPLNGHPYAINFTMAEIVIPPEFAVGLSKAKIVSSWTNNYDLIGLSKRHREDHSYGPGWTRLRAYSDTRAFLDPASYDWADEWMVNSYDYGGTIDKADDEPDSWLVPSGPMQFSSWKLFGNITFSLRDLDEREQGYQYPDEWYYIRINDVTAPIIAGAYFFRFRRLYCADPVSWSARRAKYYPGSVFFPTENWPVLVVKGEVDPAVITGTIRYGGWNSTNYGRALEVPGRVRAVGIADDPYTGKSTGRPVEARGFFNDTWRGHYEVEGVAPGVYDIYASAAGFPEVKIASNIKILKGQSYHTDGYLTPGAVIKGTVFSKCGTGEVPWGAGMVGSNGNIKIEIYKSLADAANVGIAASSPDTAVTWSPISVGASPWWYFFRQPATARYAGISFPFWETALPGTVPAGEDVWRCRSDRGVGPAQHWNVGYGADGLDTGLRSYFDFQFGRKDLYGAPCDLDAHVPRRGGGIWVNGLGAGTYWVRAFLWGYVQTLADGVTFEPVSFTVPSVEWPGNYYVPFDLRRSDWVSKTVHFHDVPGTMMQSPIGWGWRAPWQDISQTGYYRWLAGELVDGAGKMAAFGARYIPVSSSSGNVFLWGFREQGTSYGWGRNYGINAGTYTAKAYMWGYVEQVFEKVSLGLCGSGTYISDHMYRGAKFNITVYSKDWQHPTADKYWSFPYMPIYLQIFDAKGTQLTPSTSHYMIPVAMQGYANTSVAIWPYYTNNPWHMILTHNAYGQVSPYAGSGFMASWPKYKYNYFGPPNLGYLRAYDGAEHMNYFTAYYGEEPAGEGVMKGYYPLSFESGVYSFKALTYGYVQKKPVSVGATKGNATADILVKLTQGAEFDLTIKFKHQGVFEGIPFDATMRVRVFDDKGALVGEYLTSDWWWQPQYELRSPANTLRYTWNLFWTKHPLVPTANTLADVHRSYWRINYIPAGTREVRCVIAGLPDLYGWVGGASPDPYFDLGYDRKIAAPYGIDAFPNYKGGYKVEVDIVPTGSIWSTIAPPWTRTSWYPPSDGRLILVGESPKYIPENHFGPYELRYDVVAPGTHLGGESSMIFELDRRARAYGYVIGYTWCDDFRPTSWTLIQFTAADGKIYNFYSSDGYYGAYLPSGLYTMATIFWTPAKQEGYKVYTTPLSLSDGASARVNVHLEQSGVPIPEFPVAAVMLVLSLAASLVILRRRRK